MFNWVDQFRIFQFAVEGIHFLFSYEPISDSFRFQCNDFFPVNFHARKKCFKEKTSKWRGKIAKTDYSNSQNIEKKLLFPKFICKSPSKSSNYAVLHKYWKIHKLSCYLTKLNQKKFSLIRHSNSSLIKFCNRSVLSFTRQHLRIEIWHRIYR